MVVVTHRRCTGRVKEYSVSVLCEDECVVHMHICLHVYKYERVGKWCNYLLVSLYNLGL